MASAELPQVDFDAIQDRQNSHSLKWTHYSKTALPYWIMDMDFATPRFIQDALVETVQEGFLGYSRQNAEMNEILAAWVERNHGWKIDPDWVVWLPDVKIGMQHAAVAACDVGDSLMMHAPIYYPFRLGSRRFKPIHVEMERTGARWEINFDAMRSAVRDDTKLLFFCNPQNPTCRVYTRSELQDVMDFCVEHDLVLCSDEVHSLFILDETCEHACIGAMAPEGFDKTITLFSPSKTYNLSGCACGAAVIPNAELRARFARQRSAFSSLGRLNIAATKAAFSDTSDYVPELLAYLRENRKLVHETLSEVSGLDLTRNEGTYNAFFDLKKFRIENITDYFLNYEIALMDCASYGAPTATRLNFATPRALLKEGLSRLQDGLANLERV